MKSQTVDGLSACIIHQETLALILIFYARISLISESVYWRREGFRMSEEEALRGNKRAGGRRLNLESSSTFCCFCYRLDLVLTSSQKGGISLHHNLKGA